MKRSLVFAALFPLVVAAALAHADDKAAPAKSSVAVKIASIKKGEKSDPQIVQYGVCDTLRYWGFSVQSHVPTSWDEFLKKSGIVVVPPEDKDKKDAKKPAPTAFTIVGTVESAPHKVPFYQGTVPLICFIARVRISLKDANGKELKKIAWNNRFGENEDANQQQGGEQKVLDDSMKRVVECVVHDLFSTKELADQVPADKKEAFKKFMADNEPVWKEKFDPIDDDKLTEDEKKVFGGDEKK